MRVRGNGQGTILHHKNGKRRKRFEVRFTVAGSPRSAGYFLTLQEAEKRLQVLQEESNGAWGQRHSFRAFSEQWIDESGSRLSPRTIASNRGHLGTVNPHIGDISVWDVSSEEIRLLYKKLRSRYSASSLLPLESMLRSVLDSAKEKGMIKDNPAWLVSVRDLFSDDFAQTRVVYVISAESAGLVKIGTALDVERRMQGLRNSSPVPLKLIVAVEGSVKLEREIHSRLSRFRHHGEWFVLTPEVEQEIENLKKFRAVGVSVGAEVENLSRDNVSEAFESYA